MKKILTLSLLLIGLVGCKKEKEVEPMDVVFNTGESTIIVTKGIDNIEVNPGRSIEVLPSVKNLSVECKLLNCRFRFNGVNYKESTIIF